MRNLRLEIEYDGTNYCGWQAQTHRKPQTHCCKSIQETLENTLSKIVQQKVRLIGSGRTDAGVHALSQVANFSTCSKLSCQNLLNGLNSLLPKDIVINDVFEVPQDFHSCRSAKSKTYRYIILNDPRRSAFLDRFAYQVKPRLDLRLMRQEAKALLGRHDFRTFCASGSSAKTFKRNIKRIQVKTPGSGMPFGSRRLLCVEIEADGFLYNMVRNIVGTLIDLGRGRFKKGDLEKMLYAKDRKTAGMNAPAKGLFLVKVKY